jgi:hypothetical protein
MKCLIMQFSPAIYYLLPHTPKCSSQHCVIKHT